MVRDPIDRYLRLLGVARRKPGLEALTELVRAHLERVPFENLSKLYRLRRTGLVDVPDLEEYLDGIERLRLGGTCYANNAHLNELLVALGYRVRLCGADMSRPDVHVVNLVELDGREFLVDAGYGAPFLAPMPLDLGRDHVVALGRDRYVLRPHDREGRSALELHRDGEALALRNLSIVEAWGDQEQRRALTDRGELVRAAEAVFGVPREVTTEALAGVQDLATDPWA